MDESYGPDRPATTEEIQEYERLRELWQAEQECVKAAADAEDRHDTEAKWLPISISRARGQNTMDTVETELADLEISAFTEEKLVDFLITEEPLDEARMPTPPPEQGRPKLMPRRVEPYGDYLLRANTPLANPGASKTRVPAERGASGECPS